ncbi:MAG: hypothetical protein WC637_05430 [Victivallales bacterium]|jgi:hypothetical protein
MLKSTRPFEIKSGRLFIFLLFLCIFIFSFSMRTFIFDREEARIAACYKDMPQPKTGTFIPFFIESAIMYSYASDVASGRGIPKYDRRLPASGNVRVCEQDTVGMEYFLGYGYRLRNMIFPFPKLSPEVQTYEDNPYFTNWARLQLRLWASTVPALIFLFLIVMRCPWVFALAGGILTCVAPAAIARYTGQDIVRGEFCMPILMSVFVVGYWYLGRPSNKKLVLLGVTAFFAMATWDMCQICFGIWGLSEIVRIICGGKTNLKRIKLWAVIYAAVLLAAVLIPYHRVHRLVFSPLVLCVIPMILVASIPKFRSSYRNRLVVMAVSLVLTLALWWTVSRISSFSDSYGHFGRLFLAKLHYLNVKPANPLLLDFDSRILWTPAMHSADRLIIRQFFPLAIYAVPLLMIMAVFSMRNRRRIFGMDMPRLYFPLFMTVFYFTAFIFVVRYHAFAILFLGVLLPLLFHDWMRNLKSHRLQFTFIWGGLVVMVALSILSALFFRGNFFVASKFLTLFVVLPAFFIGGGVLSVFLARKYISRSSVTKLEKSAVFAFLGLILFTEFSQSLSMVRNYDGYYLPETAGLIQWFRAEGVENEVFLADFTVSPLLKAYCGGAIILQPKFELGQTRAKVEKYINEIFHGNERSFSKFCADNGARYYVFDRGHAGDMGIYSSRYCAAALKLEGDSPVNRMFMPQEREKLRCFYEVEPPPELKFISNKFIVFKVISPEDSKNAVKWTKDAKKFLDNGHIDQAARLVKAAVFADPVATNTRLLYIQLYGKVPDIRMRGF